MSAHGFRSVFMVGAIAGTALSCYLVSLRVASERAALESVENQIVLAQRDIRLLETEIGTRGRLAQLERWNVKVIRLSAPSADQFVEGAYQLATLATPERAPEIEAPIVLAAAPRPPSSSPSISDDSGVPQRASRPLGEMIHIAGLSKPELTGLRKAIEQRPVKPKAESSDVKAKIAAAKPAATKIAKAATADPLAPLFSGPAKPKSVAGGGTARAATRTSKDAGSH